MSKNAFASDMGGDVVPSEVEPAPATVSFHIVEVDPADIARYRERLAGSAAPAAWVAGWLAQCVRRWAESGTVRRDALREALAVATVWQEVSVARPALALTCPTCAAPLSPAGTHDCQPRIIARGSSGPTPRQDKALYAGYQESFCDSCGWRRAARGTDVCSYCERANALGGAQ